MAALKATFIVVACVATVLQQTAGFSAGGHHIFDKFAALAHIKFPTTTALPPRPDPITIITFPTYTDTNPTLTDTPTSTDPFLPTVIDTPIDTPTNADNLPGLNGNAGANNINTPIDTAIDTPTGTPGGVVPVPNVNGTNVRSLNDLRLYYDNEDDDEVDNEIIELDEEDLSEGRATSPQRLNNKRRKPNRRNRRRQQQIKLNRQRQNEWRRRQNQRRRQALLNQRRRDDRQRLLRLIRLLNQRSRRPLQIRIRRVSDRAPLQYFSQN